MTKKVYLCGPINGCTDEECKDWREMLKQRLGEDSCVDPMRRDYRGREDDCVEEIVELDKIDILECDSLIVNYDKPSVGTSMEVLYAWMHHKIIIVVCAPDTRISPWLRYHSTRIVHSFQDALEDLQHIRKQRSWR